MGEFYDKALTDAITKIVQDGLKAAFKRTPPEALTYLHYVVKEKVLPILRKEGIPITEEELLDMFNDWFVKTGRFKLLPPKNQHRKVTPQDSTEPFPTNIV